MAHLSYAQVKGFIDRGCRQVQLDFSYVHVQFVINRLARADYFPFSPRFQHIILSLEVLVQTGCPYIAPYMLIYYIYMPIYHEFYIKFPKLRLV